MSDNTAGAGFHGGGIYNSATGTLNLGDTKFCGNTPDDVFGFYNDLGGNKFC